MERNNLKVGRQILSLKRALFQEKTRSQLAALRPRTYPRDGDRHVELGAEHRDTLGRIEKISPIPRSIFLKMLPRQPYTSYCHSTIYFCIIIRRTSSTEEIKKKWP